MDDMKEELSGEFGDLSELSYEGNSEENFLADNFELDGEKVNSNLGKAIEAYCKENVVFSTFDHAMNYWDGNNMQTIYYDQYSMDCPPFEKLSNEEAQPILDAFDVVEPSDYETVAPGIHVAHCKGYSFVRSQFERDNWMYAEVRQD